MQNNNIPTTGLGWKRLGRVLDRLVWLRAIGLYVGLCVVIVVLGLVLDSLI